MSTLYKITTASIHSIDWRLMVSFADHARASLFLSGTAADFPIRFHLYIQHT